MEFLASKRHMPVLADILPRDRLISLIQQGALRLVSIVAGAGYGKTTLAAAALSGIRERVIWYRLDRQDRDVKVFTAYLLARGPGSPPGNPGSEGLGGPVSAHVRINRLIADLSGLPAIERVLVLDDFHMVEESPEVCGAVAHLLEYLPGHIRVMILSRRALPLKLSRRAS